MTKALQEKLFIQANIHPRKTKSIFACVRYGNVLGSTGSVFPLFLKQVANNHHITLTDKRMTRFLITLEETTTLVFTAMREAVGGEIFIPDMKSHTIVDMAELVQEFAKTKNKKIKIIDSGIRVGEKLHETLIHPTDSLRTIKMKNYFIILPDISIPQTSKKYATEKKAKEFRYSSDTGKMLDKDKLKQILTKTGLFS
jgi:FlaA1/EpsC-like NDP-sugar epimerase